MKKKQLTEIECLKIEELEMVNGGGTPAHWLDDIETALSQGWYDNGLQCVALP